MPVEEKRTLGFDAPDAKRLRVILDTDTACEADDPFAVAHALMSPKLMVQAIVAAHFAQEGSMEKSRVAAENITRAMCIAVPVLAGEEYPLDPHAPPSPGVLRIIEEARKEDPHPLFILCMGALSNVARALREAPDIIGRITIITIGGNPYDAEPPRYREFNFGNDIDAANTVLFSGADVWQIPNHVYCRARVSLAELEYKVAPCGAIGSYLFRQMAAYSISPAAGWAPAESWALGDNPAVGAALHPDYGSRTRIPAHRVRQDTGYEKDGDGPMITVYQDIDQRYLLEDFFAKLRLCYGPQG